MSIPGDQISMPERQLIPPVNEYHFVGRDDMNELPIYPVIDLKSARAWLVAGEGSR